MKISALTIAGHCGGGGVIGGHRGVTGGHWGSLRGIVLHMKYKYE